jgi:PAS domain S-box-containing protein
MGEAERLARFGVWRWDVATGRVRWSPELERIYGLEPGAFAGTVEAFVSFLHPEDRDRVWDSVQRAIETHEPFVWEERILRPDGQERVLRSQGRTVLGEDGAVIELVGVCHDVTDRVAAERALGHGERRMRAIMDNTPSLITVKDLDGRYLMANEEAGRIAGVHPDEMVGRQCADLFPTLAEQFRRNDRAAAGELEPVYDDAVLIVDGEPRTYRSVTFALPDERGYPIETCTIATDVTERRHREIESQERRSWTRRIELALDEGRMRAYAQPVVDIRTGEAPWSELLVRMEEPDGVQLPGVFLPAAERWGLVQAIDVWMVEQAVALAPGLSAEVNLSAVSLCDPGVRERIGALLRAAPDAATRIVFEITETAAARNLEAACAFAEELTELGCGLALDDFGTGFGSFTYLRQLPIRYLKIDMSFVRDLPRSPGDQRVVRSIVSIAAQFGLRTIAEGVEDEPTLELLRELGADYAQGFLLGRPSPVPADAGAGAGAVSLNAGASRRRR